MPSAPTRLPRTAVRGCDIALRPRMNITAAMRYAILIAIGSQSQSSIESLPSVV
jgi:hypothetical protein